MHDAYHTQRALFVILNLRGLSRVQGSMTRGGVAESFFTLSRQRQHGSDIGLNIKKVDAACRCPPLLRFGASDRDSGHHSLLTPLGPAAPEASSHFEKAHTVLSTILIVNQRLDQTGPQRSPHHR